MKIDMIQGIAAVVKYVASQWKSQGEQCLNAVPCLENSDNLKGNRRHWLILY
jgi:hypothetical protein